MAAQQTQHIAEDDLERYYLGMIRDQEELAHWEEHLLGCPLCVEKAEAAESYVDTIRTALLAVNDPW